MSSEKVAKIPVGSIRVVNPRSRSKVKWQSIVQSIDTVGLKRPITVSRRSEPDSEGKTYDLVCGQGRLEAVIALGEESIPAIVVDASESDRLLMSLVENIARRPASHTAMLHEIRNLQSRGYKVEDIAAKLGVDRTYVYGIAHLIERGEETLVKNVEAGRIPLSVAIEIAAGNDAQVSRALSEAYEKGDVRGHHIRIARRIITQRIAKNRREGKTQSTRQPLTGKALAREYRERIRDQKVLILKADRTREHILLLISAMRTLLADENFTTLLRAEGLHQVPAELANRLQ